MMKPSIELQDQGDAFIFIANYHAMTSVKDAAALKSMTLDVALDLLACGINPDKTALYRQSDVPEVHELAWMLSVLTPMGLLERCHSFKDKMAKGITASHGLFAYPILMAADILSVNANVVPVGRDQKQQLRLQGILQFDLINTYGDVFIIPDASIKNDVSVIPGIDGQKMSKSYDNTIEILVLEKIKKRIMKIVTDSKGLEESKNPNDCNIFKLYKLFTDNHQQNFLAERYHSGGMGYGHAKTELYETIEDYFQSIRENEKS